MGDPVHLQARADQCSLPVIVQGNRIVSYQGEQYVMLGLYFARNMNGNRELYFILRVFDGDARAGRPDRGGVRRHRGGAMTTGSLEVDATHDD
ncbi:MAG TPA: hypothetical protein VFF86_07510 [Candidatus Methylomirabilis sp.]|nr:hypothetical protein [Candidatus Methylomirabilis sp.]